LGEFTHSVNLEMVLLESPSDEDLAWLQQVIARHGEETGSSVAERLLSRWGTPAARFVKVMPTDYKRVLEAAAAARNAGQDEVAAIMASSRV
ncbi:MAG: hypothetical protein AAEB43_04645, partial [Acidimicrobiales bacterium]